MTSSPITKLWYITVTDPQKSTNDPAFLQVWKDILAHKSFSGPTAQLWQNISIPGSLVLISCWPSISERDSAATTGDETGIAEKLKTFVSSKGYKELHLDAKDLPLDAPILSVETFSVGADDAAVFEAKAHAAHSHVSDKTAAVKAVGAWDVYSEEGAPATEGKEGEAQAVKGKTWVSLTGWKDAEQHVESATEMMKGTPAEGKARETVEATPNVFETVHLKKLL